MSVNIHVYTCSAVLIWRLYGHHTIVHQDCTHLRALRWGGERGEGREGGGGGGGGEEKGKWEQV